MKRKYSICRVKSFGWINLKGENLGRLRLLHSFGTGAGTQEFLIRPRPFFPVPGPNNGASFNVYVSVGPPLHGKLVLWPHVLNRGRHTAPTFPKTPVSFFSSSLLFIPFLSIHLSRFSFGFINWPSRILVRVFVVRLSVMLFKSSLLAFLALQVFGAVAQEVCALLNLRGTLVTIISLGEA